MLGRCKLTAAGGLPQETHAPRGAVIIIVWHERQAMDERYRIENPEEIFSPAVVVFEEIVDENLQKTLAIAGSAERLRPHCKTHKMREIVQKQLAQGITRHKCATFAEAEMLVQAGVRDIVLAYNLVGPNIQRCVHFCDAFPEVTFAVTADHPRPVAQLGEALAAEDLEVQVLLDIDSGQHRTGLPVGDEAAALYRQLADTAGVVPGGIHLYDGQNHQTPVEERRAAVLACWEPVAELRDRLEKDGLPVPRIVCGGTGSFPIYASLTDPAIELSPGTSTFFDVGYGELFPDLDFVPASLLFTRVISRPTDNRITLDLGYKAVASDPPAGKRLRFPDIPDAREVLQNEEHLVLETSEAARFQPGDELLAIPRHTCPTSALHKQVFVVRDGRVAERWDVAARDRWISV